MEIFMKNISWNCTRTELILRLAQTLHGPEFLEPGAVPFNFNVHLLRDKRGGFRLHSGTGFLTLPSVELGTRFLQLYGPSGQNPIVLEDKVIAFSSSRRPEGRPDTLHNIRHTPYRDPKVIEEETRRAQQRAATQVNIRTIQFGWDCRDQVVSVESEEPRAQQCHLCFDEDRRQFRIQFTKNQQRYIIAIRISQIDSLTAHIHLGEPVILFFLREPPTYEMEAATPDSANLNDLLSVLILGDKPLRKQLSLLPIPDHERVAPYASLVVRFICESASDLEKFRHLGREANFHHIEHYQYRIDMQRRLFSKDAMAELQVWLRKINWNVAFQVNALVRGLAVDVREMLDLLPDIWNLIRTEGKAYVALMLRDFGVRVRALYKGSGEQEGEQEEDGIDSVRACFERVKKDFPLQHSKPSLKPTDGSLYEALHVTITPTTMLFSGPFPERSNRVIRSYDVEHQESFIRVTFADESGLQYRFDREIDSRDFIRNRIGPLLLDRLSIAGRKFEFLAYSQSALKEHSVWFVKPFIDSKQGRVSARRIIESLGNFDDLKFDRTLIYCPARYAARLSQAFTATDASISVEVEEIMYLDDIEVQSGGLTYCFTDGVGTLSSELARAIWRQLKRTKRRARSLKHHPAAYQIRFMGSKGMLSVDYQLQGRAICLRQSMIKFEAPESREIEIARSFDRPTPYFLNRPLIMLLEGLGVGYKVFERFQEQAVAETWKAASSLAQAATMLETYGLGSSYRLSSVLNNLSKLGIPTLQHDRFYGKAIEFVINHILRLLKNHARIPIPGAWTLVGVADVHRYLQPHQIFACVKPLTEKAKYLEGPVLISRSPTIHPGDVQVVHAIGAPPPGSPFEQEALANTVVFSVFGERPLPSCLGGGDLDGDIYNLIPLNDPSLAEFWPPRTYQASKYTPAKKKLLERKSTMADVADFVMEYIISDVLGIIAINWLIIADQSPEGIHDLDCIKLANLHSDAVDYPKTGNPVALSAIPKLKRRIKPDWNAPETVNPDSEKYYESSRIIGRLFRAIDLPAEHQPMQGATRIQSNHRRGRTNRNANGTADQGFAAMAEDQYFKIIELRVQEFIATEEPFSGRLQEDAEQTFLRYASDLQGICLTHTLSFARNASLTEEEAFVGTIVQKTSQPRKRKDMISKLREKTDTLVRGMREELEGDDGDTEEDYLQRSWFAWNLSLDKGREFGAQSFGWVALGGVFEAIRQIEEREEKERLRLY